MAKVIWNRQAEIEWRRRLHYGIEEFGEITAINFVKRTNFVVELIRKYPKIGTPEPLLLEKKRKYRHFHLIGPLKIIYHYVESSDTIRISDVWDVRCEPSRLVKRIR